MLKSGLLLILITLLYACIEDVKPTVESIEKLELTFPQKMKLFLDEPHLLHIGIDKTAIPYFIDYYKEREYQPRWIEKDTLWTKEATNLKSILKNKAQFGLPEKRYDFLKIDTNSIIESEIRLTALFTFLINDLKKGIFIKDTNLVRPCSIDTLFHIDSLPNFNTYEPIAHQIIKEGPEDTNYLNFAFALYNYCKKYTLDTTAYDIKPEKIDTINSLLETKKALFSKGYIQDMKIDSLNFRKTIEAYQYKNNLKIDGKIGYNTARMLNESTIHKIARAGITLDKLRQKEKYDSSYIRINLPEYILRYIYKDTVISQHRVIIGSTKTPTPSLLSEVKKIVLYPYWYVPYSISSKEILPHLKKDTTYLKKHNYKVFKRKEEVDVSSINWKKIKANNFPFNLRQDFGPSNSLGLLKIYFYNPYWVYVHDTPNKKLFHLERRALSHGCIRCDSVQVLAQKMIFKDRQFIEEDTLNMDTLFSRKENISIPLEIKIPIHIEYETVLVQTKQLIFLEDVYGRDEEYLKAWKGK